MKPNTITGRIGIATRRNPPASVHNNPILRLRMTKKPRTARKTMIDTRIPICEKEMRAGRLIGSSRTILLSAIYIFFSQLTISLKRQLVNTKSMNETIWRLVGLGQLSLLLEASSPKPGNVNRSASFSDMDYRHFLTSASLISRGLYECASRGTKLASGQISAKQVHLGELIELCARDSLTGLNTKNTILGSILLYVPLTVAIASTIEQTSTFSTKSVKNQLSRIIDNTSVDDSIHLYRTFQLTPPSGRKIKEEPEWTDLHSRYDFDNPDVISNIKNDEITLVSLFRMSAEIDEISNEWANYFPMVLNKIYPYLSRLSTSLEDIEEAIVRTYIWLLSERPDGLIIKKAGKKKAEEVQQIAVEIVKGWNEDRELVQLVLRLDEELKVEGNLLNPGTTADLVSATTLCRLVSLSHAQS